MAQSNSKKSARDKENIPIQQDDVVSNKTK